MIGIEIPIIAPAAKSDVLSVPDGCSFAVAMKRARVITKRITAITMMTSRTIAAPATILDNLEKQN
jgi:hypothetical protein